MKGKPNRISLLSSLLCDSYYVLRGDLALGEWCFHGYSSQVFFFFLHSFLNLSPDMGAISIECLPNICESLCIGVCEKKMNLTNLKNYFLVSLGSVPRTVVFKWPCSTLYLFLNTSTYNLGGKERLLLPCCLWYLEESLSAHSPPFLSV